MHGAAAAWHENMPARCKVAPAFTAVHKWQPAVKANMSCIYILLPAMEHPKSRNLSDALRAALFGTHLVIFSGQRSGVSKK
jgi:hypothetical protein